MQNIFGIPDNILVIGYDEDGTDHDKVVYNVLRVCKEVNLKLDKDKCHFRYMSIPFFGKVVSRKGVQPDPQKIKALINIPVPKNKRGLQALLDMINYLGKFSPDMAEVCETTMKADIQ